MKILYCFLYLAGTGILGFLLGRIVPKRWFCADRFPFRVRPWEQKLYQALRVKQWQNKVPDMSRVFPKLMPPHPLRAGGQILVDRRPLAKNRLALLHVLIACLEHTRRIAVDARVPV